MNEAVRPKYPEVCASPHNRSGRGPGPDSAGSTGSLVTLASVTVHGGSRCGAFPGWRQHPLFSFDRHLPPLAAVANDEQHIEEADDEQQNAHRFFCSAELADKPIAICFSALLFPTKAYSANDSAHNTKPKADRQKKGLAAKARARGYIFVLGQWSHRDFLRHHSHFYLEQHILPLPNRYIRL